MLHDVAKHRERIATPCTRLRHRARGCDTVHAAATQCTRLQHAVATQVRDESFWEYLDMSGHDEFCRKTGDTFFLDGNLRH